MKHVLIVLSVAAVLAAAGSASAADEKKPKRDPEKLFKKLDADGDGKLTAAEFRKLAEMGKGKAKDNPELLDKRFTKVDANGDGALSLEEFKKMLERKKKKTDKPQDNP